MEGLQTLCGCVCVCVRVYAVRLPVCVLILNALVLRRHPHLYGIYQGVLSLLLLCPRIRVLQRVCVFCALSISDIFEHARVRVCSA